MKRVKKIIESFLNIGQDPGIAISSAWARVCLSASTANKEDLALIERIIGGVAEQAAEMQKKSATEAKS